MIIVITTAMIIIITITVIIVTLTKRAITSPVWDTVSFNLADGLPDVATFRAFEAAQRPRARALE